MKRVLVLIPLLLVMGAGRARAADGKATFLASKCNRCHTVDVAAIAVLPKTAPEPGEEVEKPEKEPKKPFDLSKIGADHDTAALKAWLRRETFKEGKKHKMKFKGTDEDMAAIADWLTTLK